jgi:hypothetical protein
MEGSSQGPAASTPASARAHLAEAQRCLDLHITSAVTGRCVVCHEPGPCEEREVAERAFADRGLLPRRRPAAALADGAIDQPDL